MSVNNIISDGERIVTVENDTWHGEIVLTNNANLIRLKHIPFDVELLRTPASLKELRGTPERYGMPLLFPPGRIENGSFDYNGRAYNFPVTEPENNCNLHGIILGNPWELSYVEEKDSDITVSMYYEYDQNHKNFSGYPHEFRLDLTYDFSRDAVTQKTSLTNCGDEPMPFGLGYHTAFNTKQDCKIMVTTGNGRWEIHPQHRLPTGKFLPLNKNEKFNLDTGMKVGDNAIGMLCPAETILKDGKTFSGAKIISPSDNIEVTYEVSDKYKFWALWNDGGGKGFFCIEPLTWMSNAPNIVLPSRITGLSCLSPGNTQTYKCKITICHYE